MTGKQEVAAAIIRNDLGQILICQRGAGGSCAYLYEFPGGKTEAHESLQDCLIRECREELALELAVGREVYMTEHIYPDIHVELHFFLCTKQADAEPTALEHASIRWVYLSELAEYEFCPGDTELLDKIAGGEIQLF